MGGLGSGRHSGDGKSTTSRHLALDVRKLHRDGILQPGQSGRLQWSRNGEPFAWVEFCVDWDSLRLIYRQSRNDGPWTSHDYSVSIERTQCHYGGERPWFRCPGCRRRVAILYSGDIFACRNCNSLNYDSQHEQPYQRALTRVQSIRVRLGGHPAIGPFPDKPRRMHWRTYCCYCSQAKRAQSASHPNWLARMLA